MFFARVFEEDPSSVAQDDQVSPRPRMPTRSFTTIIRLERNGRRRRSRPLTPISNAPRARGRERMGVNARCQAALRAIENCTVEYRRRSRTSAMTSIQPPRTSSDLEAPNASTKIQMASATSVTPSRRAVSIPAFCCGLSRRNMGFAASQRALFERDRDVVQEVVHGSPRGLRGPCEDLRRPRRGELRRGWPSERERNEVRRIRARGRPSPILFRSLQWFTKPPGGGRSSSRPHRRRAAGHHHAVLGTASGDERLLDEARPARPAWLGAQRTHGAQERAPMRAPLPRWPASRGGTTMSSRSKVGTRTYCEDAGEHHHADQSGRSRELRNAPGVDGGVSQTMTWRRLLQTAICIMPRERWSHHAAPTPCSSWATWPAPRAIPRPARE